MERFAVFTRSWFQTFPKGAPGTFSTAIVSALESCRRLPHLNQQLCLKISRVLHTLLGCITESAGNIGFRFIVRL
jgi:hypothetical protein